MTLIELMATLAITSMLVIGALGVAANLSRSEKINAALHDADMSYANMKTILQLDMTHATKVRKTAAGFELQVRAGLDPESMRVTHIESTVAYEITDIAGRKWLVRKQQDDVSDSTSSKSSNDSNNSKNFAELVAPDISEVSLHTADDAAAELSGSWKAIGDSVILKIRTTGSQQEQSFLLRK